MATMRVVQVSRPNGPFEVVERPIPEPNAGWVRIKVQACGICHSDSLIKEGTYPGVQYPRVPGHEIAGVIDALGPGVDIWRQGQRVGVGWHGGHCGHCDRCRRGDFVNCVKSRRQPRANALAAAQTHILCHAAYIAFQLGRKLRFNPATDTFISFPPAAAAGAAMPFTALPPPGALEPGAEADKPGVITIEHAALFVAQAERVAAAVQVVDAAKRTSVATIVLEPPGVKKDQVRPVGIAMSADGRRAFVALTRAETVAVIDVAARRVEAYWRAGKRPAPVACSGKLVASCWRLTAV